MKELRVLSLGGGVQSSTLLLLSLRGELPPLDAAIFADTQYEPDAVYDNLDWLDDLARAAGVTVYRVSRGNLRADAMHAQTTGGRLHGGARFASMPLFTLPAPDDPTGNPEGGMIRRQCTKEYKLEPIRKQVRALAGLHPGEVAGDRVRIEQSRDYWITLRYPLIFDLRPAWRRSDCVAWLRREYPDHPVPRSACIACPFHSNAEWRAIRDCDPTAWADAVAFDRAIRHLCGLRGTAYLHASRVPLEEAPIDTDDPSQGTLFSCGVCDT
jgi:hypothetical protein